MDLIEKVFGFYTTSLVRGSERFAEIKALTLLVRLVKESRRLALFFYFSMLSIVLFTAGVLIVIMQALALYQSLGTLHFDAIIIFGLTLIFMATLSSLWLLNEKRWMSMFKLDEYLRATLNVPEDKPDHSGVA